MAETHGVENQIVAGVRRVVEYLTDPDPIGLLGQSRQDRTQRLPNESGIQAEPEKRGSPCATGLLDVVAEGFMQRPGMDEPAARGHHILSRRKQVADIGEAA